MPFDDAGNKGSTSFTVTVLPSTQPQPGEVTGEIYDITSTGVDSVTLEGNVASSISAGSTGYFNTSISSEAPQNALVAIYVQGADGTPLGMTALKYVVGMTESELRMGLSIPGDAASGTANVYVNVLTDWPQLSGMDLMDGESITNTVQINELDNTSLGKLNYSITGFPNVGDYTTGATPDGVSPQIIVNHAIDYWKGNPDSVITQVLGTVQPDTFNLLSDVMSYDVNSYADSKAASGDDFFTGLEFNKVNFNEANLQIWWVKEYTDTAVGHAPLAAHKDLEMDVIFVALGDSIEYGTWQPYPTGYVLHTTAHEIGHVIGFAHDGNTNSIMYSPDAGVGASTTGKEYGTVELTKEIAGGDSWSIPAFTSRDVTNFNYHVSTDNEGGVNVYFVPDLETAEAQYNDSKPIDSYSGCVVEDTISYRRPIL